MNNIIKRSDAKNKKLLYYFTGKPCKNNHIAVRQTSNGNCLECNRIYAMDHYFNNSHDRKEKVKEYQKRNPEKVNKWVKATYKNNKYSYCARAMLRHTAKLKRTPIWLTKSDKLEIELIYKIAARVSKETGIKYHVDHEIPLQGEFVSGLHVPENLSKSNNFVVGDL